ncbi:hypothetical protein Hanom_Chr16g01436361 [Helianthus anomalus]
MFNDLLILSLSESRVNKNPKPQIYTLPHTDNPNYFYFKQTYLQPTFLCLLSHHCGRSELVEIKTMLMV